MSEREGGGREGGRKRKRKKERTFTNLYHLPFHLKVVGSVAVRSESYILQREKVATINK